MDAEQLLREMERLAEAGDANAFDAFVTEHFTELPEAVQSKVLMYLTEEALARSGAEQDIGEIRREGIAALEELTAAKAALRDGDR